MKNICTLVLFLLSGISLLSGQQQDLSKLRVNYSAGKILAVDAIKEFLAQNKIEAYSYSASYLKNYRIQGVKCNNESVQNCADKILKDLPFEAIIHNNIIIFRQKLRKVSATSDTEETNPLVSTDQKRDDTLRPANKETTIEEITLNAGYYAIKDKERTGSIAKVTAKDIENQPVTNVLSAIQGRVPGVSISQTSGVPGAGYDIQIRGRNSLRNISNSAIDGNQPLYVIDGVPLGGSPTSIYSTSVFSARSISPLNSINLNDVESIEILKDADATAIYGSRGANGVVLITTKKGKSGKLSLTLNSSYGVSHIISNLRMMNTEQYLGMRKQAFTNDGISAYPATAYDLNGTWDQSRYTDWTDTLIGNTSSISNTQLSLSGGNETTTFLLSLGHNEQTTAFANGFKYTGNTITSSMAHHSRDKKFQLNISNIFSELKNNMIRTDLTRQSYLLSPNAPALYLSDGSLNWQNNTFTNPAASYNSTYDYKNKQFITNINSQYELFKGLRIKINSGFNYQDFQELALQPNTMYNPAFALGQSSATSTASQNNQKRFSFIVEPQLTWKYRSNRHEIDILLGATYQQEESTQGSMIGTGFQSNVFITNIGAATTKNISDQAVTDYRYAALYGRLNYQYRSTYILNITGRRDGSSRFGPNRRFANFGAIGAAWIFSNEQLLKNSSWLTFGKFRGSFGIAGSDNIGDYQYLDTYNVSSSIYNGTIALLPARLYNPDFSWEKTKKLEAALEIGLFKDKITFSAAWYRNRSSNQLVGYQLPAMTGFTSILANLDATVQNTGWEFDIGARPFAGDHFRWETGLNLSIPKNKLLSFPGLAGSTYANQFVIGEPTSIVKVYHLEGINPQTGQYQFTDYNGDGKTSSPDDNRSIENIGVGFFGGWTNTLKYENWDLSVLFQFVKQRSRNYNNIMASPGSMNNQPVEVLDVWSPTNPNGYYMPYRSGSNASHVLFQNSDATVSDGSYIRLKNIQLGYQIPLKNSKLTSVKIYIQGQNLITLTSYFGVDPEFLGIGFLPPLRTIAFGAQINL